MAIKRKINKSAEIRTALAEHPEMKPSQIAEMLAAKKIKVSAQMVSTIKSKTKSNGRKRTTKNGDLTVADLENTVVYLQGVGGLAKAKQLIALIEKVRNT